MLLSQSAQAKLGFVKNVRKGTIVMEDYDNQNLEVVRQKDTGLFMIRIDHLYLDEFMEFVKDHPRADAVVDKTSEAYLELQENSLFIAKQVERIKEKGEYDIYEKEDWTKADWQAYWQHQHDFVKAFMAKKAKRPKPDQPSSSAPEAKKAKSEKAEPAQDAPVIDLRSVAREEKSDLDKCNVLLVSCSELFFEESKHSAIPSTNDFQERIGFNGRNTDVEFNLNYFKTKKAFIASFRSHFPHLVESRMLTIIDCTRIERDADHDKTLRSHTGHHPTTMLNFAKAKDFETVMQPLGALRQEDTKHIVLFVCGKGTHRSVAGLELADHACEWLYYGCDDTSIRLESKSLQEMESQLVSKNVAIIHLNQDRWNRTCGGVCDICMVHTQSAAEQFVDAR